MLSWNVASFCNLAVTSSDHLLKKNYKALIEKAQQCENRALFSHKNDILLQVQRLYE